MQILNKLLRNFKSIPSAFNNGSSIVDRSPSNAAQISSRIESLFSMDNEYLQSRIRYNDKFNLLYLNVPKSGCTTIKKAIFETSTGVKYSHNIQFKKTISGSFRVNRHALRSVTDDTFIFTVVRNPAVRLFSTYYDKVVGGKNGDPRILKQIVDAFGETGEVNFFEFIDFVASIPDNDRNPHYQSLVGRTCIGSIDYNYVGCLEDPLSTFSYISNTLNYDFGFINSNSRKSHKVMDHFLTSEAYDRIYSIFKDDFEAFGYSSKYDERLCKPLGLTF